MNILFFSRLFYPHIGGVEKHVLEISKILIEKGHKITVITEQYSKELPKVEEFNGIKIRRISVGKDDWFKKFRIWKELLKLRLFIKEADIVHCHDVFFWYLPFRFLFLKKPVYVTFHGYEDYPISNKAIFVRRLSEGLAKGNICIGDFIEKWYGTKPNFVIYGGISRIQNSESRVQNLRKVASAVFIGRLDEQTGIKTYLNAVKLIRKKIPNFKFTVIGDGRLKKFITKEVAALGFQKNPEKFLRKSHFAFVSRYLSILEAMAQRKLVFAVYNNPLKEDYLKMTPFAKFINIVRNKTELSSSIFYFMKNPNKERIMIDNAFAWVKDQTWDKVVQSYLGLWK